MSKYAYDRAFMQYAAQSSAYAAATVTSHLKNALDIDSVLDVGCAAATWLRVWSEAGTSEIRGVDGDYVDASMLEIDQKHFVSHDLKQPFDLGRRFDLVQCLEVAEHLPTETSSRLVATLCAHAERYVLFSAAPPGQGGEYHINEQTYEFWRAEFKRQGFMPFDFVRPRLNGDAAISFWYRYNIMLYVREQSVAALPSQVSETAVSEGATIADISPPLFKMRKRVVRMLPAAFQNYLAQAKARAIGYRR